MTVRWLGDGSAVCNGDADPSRTATYGPPKDGTAQKASIAAFFSLEPAPAPDNSPDGLRASIPTMATGTPPAVADTGAAGSNSNQFTGPAHTHASKARKQIATQGGASATYVWTYPVAFGVGIVPIVNAIVQVANGNTDLFNVQVIGAPTNTGCTFQISRVSAGLFGLLTGALGINTPVAVTLHMLALEP